MRLLLVDFSAPGFEERLMRRLITELPETLRVTVFFQATRKEHPQFLVQTAHREDVRLSPFSPTIEKENRRIPDTIRESTEDIRSLFTSLDRVYLKPLPMLNREIIIDKWLNGWHRELEKMSVSLDVALFPRAPHFPWDMTLSLALQKRGTKVFALNESALSGFLLLSELEGTQIRRFVEFDNPVPNWTPPGSTKNLDAGTLQVSKKEVSGLFGNFLLKTEEKNPAKRLYRRMRSTREIVQAALRPGLYWSLSPFEQLLLAERWLRTRSRAFSVLNELGIKETTGEYAYFALHFQPEKSTTPEGGDYWFQINAIRKLRSHLPNHLTLVVGEHPRHLFLPLPDLRQSLFRPADLYREIGAMQGVQLAHWSLRGQDLIRNARLVATITGSSAWEAMKSGVPGVVFGKTWYSDAAGCLVADSSETSEEDILRLFNMTPKQIQQGVEAAYSLARNHGIPGYNHLTLPASFTEVQVAEVVELATRRLYEALKQGQRKRRSTITESGPLPEDNAFGPKPRTVHSPRQDRKPSPTQGN